MMNKNANGLQSTEILHKGRAWNGEADADLQQLWRFAGHSGDIWTSSCNQCCTKEGSWEFDRISVHQGSGLDCETLTLKIPYHEWKLSLQDSKSCSRHASMRPFLFSSFCLVISNIISFEGNIFSFMLLRMLNSMVTWWSAQCCKV